MTKQRDLVSKNFRSVTNVCHLCFTQNAVLRNPQLTSIPLLSWFATAKVFFKTVNVCDTFPDRRERECVCVRGRPKGHHISTKRRKQNEKKPPPPPRYSVAFLLSYQMQTTKMDVGLHGLGCPPRYSRSYQGTLSRRGLCISTLLSYIVGFLRGLGLMRGTLCSRERSFLSVSLFFFFFANSSSVNIFSSPYSTFFIPDVCISEVLSSFK